MSQPSALVARPRWTSSSARTWAAGSWPCATWTTGVRRCTRCTPTSTSTAISARCSTRSTRTSMRWSPGRW